MSAPSRPTFGQYVGYQFGRTLPDSLQDWVRQDLVGPGASARYLIRFTVPVLPILALFLLIPGPIWIPLAMMALLFIRSVAPTGYATTTNAGTGAPDRHKLPASQLWWTGEPTKGRNHE